MRKRDGAEGAQRTGPAIMAASSNEASIERNTADINRKVSGAKPTPSIRDMPPHRIDVERLRVSPS